MKKIIIAASLYTCSILADAKGEPEVANNLEDLTECLNMVTTGQAWSF